MKLEPTPRLELGTPSLPWRCSTTELCRRGAEGGIRTPEGECQLIYSQPCLTASLPLQVVRINFTTDTHL